MAMKMIRRWSVAAALVTALAASGARGEEALELRRLLRGTHIHGLAVDAQNPSRLLLATHNGLYAVTPDGGARQVSKTRDDFMGFSPHPRDPATFYASGHPASGGNLGLIRSVDGGQTWERIAQGLHGPVDFHQMAVSPADPRVIYGVFGPLQVSRDGGLTWQVAGPPPESARALAASARDPRTVYLAAQNGLMVSRDEGKRWQRAHPAERPATLVLTDGKGGLYTFILGLGLLHAPEDTLVWSTVFNEFGDQVLLHLAVDPKDPTRLFAASQKGALLAGTGGGKVWNTLASP